MIAQASKLEVGRSPVSFPGAGRRAAAFACTLCALVLSSGCGRIGGKAGSLLSSAGDAIERRRSEGPGEALGAGVATRASAF